jgi:hypothetical protein
MFVGISMLGCASTQLNFNTLDLASTIDSLVTSQVLSNLAKFLSSPYAIPSQVSIPGGSVTTANGTSASAGVPLDMLSTATNMVATTVGAASSTTTTRTNTLTGQNAALTVGGSVQWNQSWALTPVTDADQLRRLRILYQFVAGDLDPDPNSNQQSARDTAICNYPLITKKDQSGSQPAAAQPTLTYKTTDGKDVKLTFTGAKANEKAKYVVYCDKEGEGLLTVDADATFLNPPSCVVCADPSYAISGLDDNICEWWRTGSLKMHGILSYKNSRKLVPDKLTVCLHLNPRLRSGWLKYVDSPADVPAGAYYLGHAHAGDALKFNYRDYHFFVLSREDQDSFYEFCMFLLTATAQTATSSTPVIITGSTATGPR